MKLETKINPERQQLYHSRGWWGTQTLLDHWDRTVQRRGESEYVWDDRGSRLTYGQTDLLAGRLARYLHGRGVGPGDVVAIQLPNWTDYCVAYVAVLKLGAILHLLSRNTALEELCDLLSRSRAKALICPTQFRGICYEDLLPGLCAAVPCLETVVLVEGSTPARSGWDTLGAITASGPVWEGDARARADDVAALLNTSGTTGTPKIVMITHNNILFSELSFNRDLGITQADAMFMPAPLHHATGFHHGLIAPMLAGARVVLQQRFEGRQAVELINSRRCTYSMGATPFVYDILGEMERTGVRLPSMRFFLCGGAHVPQSLVERGTALGLPICEVYGSTESPPHAFVRVEEAVALAGTTSGRPIEGVEVRLVDEQGRDVPPGCRGEEWSRGPNVFVGYLGDKAATDRALDSEGWFASGDICVGDTRGNIRVVGRKKEIIIRGGENLSIHRICETLDGCPGVRDKAIVGRPDPRFGERICAFIVPEPGRAVTLQDLLDYVSARQVPKYLWPESVELIDEIPRTESGKIQCEKLQRRFAWDDTKGKDEG